MSVWQNSWPCNPRVGGCETHLRCTDVRSFRVNPISTRLGHVIYCHGDRSYPCFVGIELIVVNINIAFKTTEPKVCKTSNKDAIGLTV